MSNVTYKIIVKSNAGGFYASSLEAQIQGSSANGVQKYNGEHDLFFITFPEENAQYADELLVADDNVISYSEVAGE